MEPYKLVLIIEHEEGLFKLEYSFPDWDEAILGCERSRDLPEIVERQIHFNPGDNKWVKVFDDSEVS